MQLYITHVFNCIDAYMMDIGLQLSYYHIVAYIQYPINLALVKVFGKEEYIYIFFMDDH